MFSNLGSYDPTTVDTSYIKDVSAKIPRGGHIDLHEADQLATLFLECADRITDEIARCSAYAGYCEADRREKKAIAIDNRIQGTNGGKGVAGTIAVQIFGDDAVYKAAHEKQAVAEAFLDWLRTKYKNLMAAHVLCKDLMKIHNTGKEQGSWRDSRPHDLDGEELSEESDRVTKSSDRTFGAEQW